MSKTHTVYRVYCEGFSAVLNTVAEIQAWGEALKAKHNVAGKELSIWRGERTGDAVLYRTSTPARVITLTA